MESTVDIEAVQLLNSLLKVDNHAVHVQKNQFAHAVRPSLALMQNAFGLRRSSFVVLSAFPIEIVRRYALEDQASACRSVRLLDLWSDHAALSILEAAFDLTGFGQGGWTVGELLHQVFVNGPS